MSVRLAVFDIGGVMIQICHTWSEALAVAGVEAPAPNPDRLAQSEFLDHYQDGTLSVEEYVAALAAHCGISEEQASRVHNSILKAEYPGLIPVMESLRGFGIKTACLSNTADLHWQEMHRAERFPAFARLDYRFASHILRANKPSPEAFRAVEEATGFPGKEIVFFEDTVRNIDGARDYGWDVVAMDANGDAASQIANALRLRNVPGF